MSSRPLVSYDDYVKFVARTIFSGSHLITPVRVEDDVMHHDESTIVVNVKVLFEYLTRELIPKGEILPKGDIRIVSLCEGFNYPTINTDISELVTRAICLVVKPSFTVEIVRNSGNAIQYIKYHLVVSPEDYKPIGTNWYMKEWVYTYGT